VPFSEVAPALLTLHTEDVDQQGGATTTGT
jgi:hypothetical protein